MTPQELKNSILQLAIQGKLVEQRPEEGTARELFVQIQAEKQRLIEAGKIKKEKPLPEIAEDEKPFDIPEGWMWCRLGDIFQHNTGKALNSTNRNGISLKYITTSNLYWNRFELENLKEMYFSDTEIEKCTAKKGDLLVCEGGDFGRAAIWKNDGNICIQNHVHRLRAFYTVCTEFFYYLFYLYKHAGWIGGKGIGIQCLSSKAIHVIVFPLPPLAEQKRIVAKIEELLPYIDRYEQAWGKLEQLNSRFPEDMKKALLQYAIQGKLVEQRPEEGTGEELFAQIQAEKQRLIQARKIKKEKPLPEIAEDEVPFEIPEGWKWVRIGSVCINIQYGSSQKSDTVGKMVVLRMGNIQDGKLVLDKLVYTSNEEEIRKYSLKYNDLLFNRTNSKDLVGKTAIYKGQIPAIYAGYLVRITPIYVDSDFLNYTMQSQYYWSYCQSVRSDAIGQSNINAEKLKRFAFPLPSLAEQKRIVEKLEQLLPLCDRLKKQIV